MSYSIDTVVWTLAKGPWCRVPSYRASMQTGGSTRRSQPSLSRVFFFVKRDKRERGCLSGRRGAPPSLFSLNSPTLNFKRAGPVSRAVERERERRAPRRDKGRGGKHCHRGGRDRQDAAVALGEERLCDSAQRAPQREQLHRRRQRGARRVDPVVARDLFVAQKERRVAPVLGLPAYSITHVTTTVS